MHEPRTIYLNKEITNALTTSQLRLELKKYFRYVHVDIDRSSESFRIVGPNTYYHGADPDLVDVCSELIEEATSENILAFRERRAHFDFSLEDTWTYFFIQSHLADDPCRGFELLHLDDHPDMAPPLISKTDTSLVNTPLGIPFDPHDEGSIEAAIFSGSIGIGNFLTPLFHHHDGVRISHLCNIESDDVIEYDVIRECTDIPILEGVNRIGTRRVKLEEGRRGGDETNGTYAVSGRVDNLIRRMTDRRLIVHIDLDYFINDYDGGNVRESSAGQEAASIQNARVKLGRFFQGMRSLRRPVDRWVVATSPGFCAARHWSWLLDELCAGIEQLGT